jgi:multisubunit Na+/H+ antiporter MnhG subunit
VRPLSVDILLGLALLCEIVCVVGVFAGATVYDKLHYSGATTAVAPFLVLAALVVEQRDHSAMWNGLVSALALFFFNSVLSQAIARVARQRETHEVEL